MKRSTARWTTAFAAAALIGVPAAGWSQTPPAATSQTPAAQQPADTHAQHGAAAEEIRAAETALNDIPTSTLPASAKSRVGELKRHLNSLEKAAAASTAPSATATKPPKNTWGKDVASVDKILNELLGSATGAGASTQSTATGTTGSTQPKASAQLTLDDTTKAKLMEVREHVTKFAASMSNAPSTPGATSPAPSAEPAAAAAPSAAPTPSAESTSPAASASSASAQSAAPSAAAEQAQAQAQAPTAQAPAAAASSQVDEETAKRHLTAARDSLAQLTQLPAAAQLTGEARTQVSQLIGNFNQLITAKADWRASYDKVDANVTALIGADAAPAEASAAPAGTPGAVGTSGSTAVALDPAIKGKLVEFRSHLKDFEKAAGTATSDAPSASAASSASAPSAMSSSSSTPAASPSSSSSPMSSSAASSSASPAASPSSPAPEAAASSPAESSAAAQQRPSTMNQDSPVTHIEAIEAIIGSGSKLTLEPAQVQQIRMHLAELRKAVDNDKK